MSSDEASPSHHYQSRGLGSGETGLLRRGTNGVAPRNDLVWCLLLRGQCGVVPRALGLGGQFEVAGRGAEGFPLFRQGVGRVWHVLAYSAADAALNLGAVR